MRRFQHLDGQYEQDLAQARSMLDPEVWQAAWLAGSALTLEQAVEEALAELSGYKTMTIVCSSALDVKATHVRQGCSTYD